MRTMIVCTLLIMAVIPCTLFSEIRATQADLAFPCFAYDGLSEPNNGMLAMGSNPPDQGQPQGSSLCTCWACSWDQRIYCNNPQSHSEHCKELTFSCNGPSPSDCCKK